MSSVNDMKKACDMAARLYQSLFERNDKAQSYVSDRGLSEDTVTRLGIGVSPDEWQSLTNSLPEELLEAGVEAQVIGKSDSNRHYDFFRDRLMFPIANAQGEIVGFGGRTFDAESNPPKYLNSPKTPIFDKRSLLYNLNNAKQYPDNLIVAEGYMDVAAGETHNIRNMVGTLGTAFTLEHAELLNAHQVKRVTFCFDGDKAGRDAALRTLEVCPALFDNNITPYFSFMPDGKDPDDVLNEQGRDVFVHHIQHASTLHQFVANETSNRIERDNPNSIDSTLKHSAWAQDICQQNNISFIPVVEALTKNDNIGYMARKCLYHYSDEKMGLKTQQSDTHKAGATPL